MRRILRKYGFLLCLTGVLLAFAFYGTIVMKISPFYVHLETDNGPIRIDPYQSETGDWYVFLPSWADMNNLTMQISAGRSVSVNGERLSDGESCGKFSLKRDYPVEIGGESAAICFLRSENVATLYLKTRSANMEYVHEDKNNEEAVSLQLFDAQGNLDCTDDGGMIKGRGNATWNMDKKPYQVTLSREYSLLGMKPATKWVLLSNAMDESNLHNKLIYDLAAALNMEWTPGCTYVDVYLNGKYNGLYLLSEKVEAGDNRLDIDTDAGDFLCKADLEDRWDTLRNPVKTDMGRTVEITAPEELSAESKAAIKSRIGELEKVITSGEDLRQESVIDLESWVLRYLIDEISGNIDSDVASSYFYRRNGVFYAGPVWDYDMTFGIHHRGRYADAFIAKNLIKASGVTSDYYAALYENPSFYDAVVQTYQTSVLPLLETLADGCIRKRAEQIAAASAMNSLRWRQMFDEQYVPMGLNPSDADRVTAYLKERMEFLDSAWVQGETYYCVQFELEKDRSYGTVSVKAGEQLAIPDQDIQRFGWYIAETGETFDPDQPIGKDMLLLLP